MFNHWYTWVLLILVVVAIVYRKKLKAIWNSADKELTQSGSLNSPLANLEEQTRSALDTQNAVLDAVSNQAEYNNDLISDADLMDLGLIKDSSFLNLEPPHNDSKIKLNRDQSWWPTVMYENSPVWAMSR